MDLIRLILKKCIIHFFLKKTPFQELLKRGASFTYYFTSMMTGKIIGLLLVCLNK